MKQQVSSERFRLGTAFLVKVSDNKMRFCHNGLLLEYYLRNRLVTNLARVRHAERQSGKAPSSYTQKLCFASDSRRRLLVSARWQCPHLYFQLAVRSPQWRHDVLRLDDTDVERNTDASVNSIFEPALARSCWDEEYRQSERLALHREIAGPPFFRKAGISRLHSGHTGETERSGLIRPGSSSWYAGTFSR